MNNILEKNETTIFINEKLQNCLIQYHGGGYDGCFWEYNYAFFNNQSEFIDIYSSGRKALKNKDEIIDYINYDNSYTIYHFKNNEESLKKFSKQLVEQLPYSNINPIFKTLYKKTDLAINQYCKICDSFDYPDNFISGYDLGYYQGNGGIGIEESIEPICSECYFNNKCNCCDSWFNPNDTIPDNEGLIYNEFLKIEGCNNCLEQSDIALCMFFYNHDFDIKDIEKNINELNNKQLKLFPDIDTNIKLSDYTFYNFNDSESLYEFNLKCEENSEMDIGESDIIDKILNHLSDIKNKDVIIFDKILYIQNYKFTAKEY